MSSIWYMDSECCDKCGGVLRFGEYDFCADCYEDRRYDEEQERYAVYDDEEEQPTIGTPEEAYAAALSLVDEEEAVDMRPYAPIDPDALALLESGEI